MSYNVRPASTFQRDAKALIKRYASLKNELAAPPQQLTENPALGTLLGNNCYKIRLAIKSKGKGKLGDTRVITLVQIVEGQVLVLTIYGKAEKEDLRPGELQKLLKLVDLE